jgi:N-methylhydantoinase A/oxoprolinase/acetone carboxylase beta subunit
LAIDIGGTFTDLALHDADSGELTVAKTLSTPSDPSEGALEGVEMVLERADVALSDVGQITHATTHGANIIIEGKGARAALLTTAGFADVLMIQRQLRYSPYDLALDRHAPLIPRSLVFEVPERLRYDGEVHRPLDEVSVREITKTMIDRGVESVAVCLLHSYVNAAHEQRVAEILREAAPDLPLSLSSEVAPLIREYERASTTVADAYLRPAFQRYLANLREALVGRGFEGQLFIMQANGGIASVELTMEAPIRAVESGPAGAVAMATALSRDQDLGDALAFDMGGTTAKAGLIAQGAPGMVDSFEVDRSLLRMGTGLPLRIPSVDIIEIGAGGGSIAHDELGIIEVGPESSGANPGPASYGLGGEQPTVTDANLILGYLNPEFFNGGAFDLHPERARRSVQDMVAWPLGLELKDAAWGVHEAVTANMEHAIRATSIDRGHDPRTLTLVASGGAAPLHALRIARDLGMQKVLIPAFAGVMSALGLLDTDPRFDLAVSVVVELSDEVAAEFDTRFAALEDQALARLKATGLDGTYSLERRIDACYRGQGHTIEVELPSDESMAGAVSETRERFIERYAELYGKSDREEAIEVTALRVTAVTQTPSIVFPIKEKVDQARPEKRDAYFPEAGGYTSTAVYRRAELSAGQQVVGPAIIEDAESTLVVPPGDTVTADRHQHLLAEVGTSRTSSSGDG